MMLQHMIGLQCYSEAKRANALLQNARMFNIEADGTNIYIYLCFQMPVA